MAIKERLLIPYSCSIIQSLFQRTRSYAFFISTAREDIPRFVKN